MATFLDIGVLGYFRVIFAMILIFVIMYGFLSWTKPFGDKGGGLYSLISIAFAILSMTSKGVLTLVTFMAPWFFVIIFIAFFILFVLMIFGLKEKDLTAGTTSNLRTWVVIITVVILLFGLGSAFGQGTLDKGSGTTGDGSSDTSGTTDISAGGSIGTGDNVTGSPDSTSTTDFGSNVLNTLVNPQVLGMILVLLVGVFTIFLLTAGNL